MRIVGMSANLMSLGGLAIAIGMLIDALVVVVENVVRHLSKDPQGRAALLVHIIFRSVCEVLQPVASGVLIIMIVFVPLLTLQGLSTSWVGRLAPNSGGRADILRPPSWARSCRS